LGHVKPCDADDDDDDDDDDGNNDDGRDKAYAVVELGGFQLFPFTCT